MEKKQEGGKTVEDLINYKGIYFEDDSDQKYSCPITGAHFEYLDMYRRLKRVLNERTKEDQQEIDLEHQKLKQGQLNIDDLLKNDIQILKEKSLQESARKKAKSISKVTHIDAPHKLNVT
jgi:hypothetical protein